jgi:cytochrome o ubiquinol oxidase subunit IV
VGQLCERLGERPIKFVFLVTEHPGIPDTVGYAFCAADAGSSAAQPLAPGIPVGLIVLAFAQIGVHLVFFLHLGSGPDSTNNILALAFGVLIVFLVITGSVWIIAKLNSDMMPKSMQKAGKFYARAPRHAGQKPFLRNRFRKAESSRGRGIDRAAYHLQHLRIR